jgi:hypothetical protein
MTTFRTIGVVILMIVATQATDAQQTQIEDLNTILMNTTFRMHGSGRTAGTTTGGTVFVLGKPTSDQPDKVNFVMVTAAHVLDDIATDDAIITYRERKQDGGYATKPHTVPLRKAGVPLYVKHPSVDVAALYVTMPSPFASNVIVHIDLLANDELINRFELHPGDELNCLGFPLLAHADHGFPILRSGKIASYPLTPVKDHKNWLFDFRVFKGNSGGPVYFIDRNRVYANHTHVGETIQIIVGLVTSQMSSTIVVPNQELQIGIVIPAAFIRETIDLLPSKPASP